MDKPICLGFSLLELSMLHMCESYYEILQPYFWGKIYTYKNIQTQQKDTDSSVSSVFRKDNIKDLKNLEDIFDFSSLCENHELF